MKQDPQFIFDTPTAMDSVTETPPKRIKANIIKTKTRSAHSVDEDTVGADLYVPGDIVWSKLGSFPWWPALIVIIFYAFSKIINIFFYSIGAMLKMECIQER